MNCREFIFKNLLSSLNHPIDPLDWTSNWSKPFLRMVTTACFIYINSSVPLSTSFVEDLFSINGISANSSVTLSTSFVYDFFSKNDVVTASYLLSPKNDQLSHLKKWWIIPWTFPLNLLTPDIGWYPNSLVKI